MTKPTYGKTFTLKAFLRLGGEQVELSGELKGDQTTLAVRFKRLSLEKMINDLIQLVRPTYRLELPYPWDRILDFELKDLLLSYNIKEKTIGFACDFKFKVPFLELKRVYIDARSVHEVMIRFDGTILGEEYKDDNKLGWNLVGPDGPPTPPPPPSVFDLKFLGMGQHVRMTHAAQYERVGDAIAGMAALFEPPKPGTGTLIPDFSKALAFDNNSNWLFGLDAEIMGTVALSIIFNDPNLYGLYIRLKGEKAKSLAGLEFEILYKKVTEDIGVYQIELKLPAYIRNMEFGAVSVTLPQIGVDIYTNGNFKIDFGFPRNLDFSDSFAVQVFPFVGFGGFYFAVLNGATSSTVPVTDNGTFNPVLEFGIGLQLGVGKTIDKGILQASATLTYVGVVEGTLAWFKANKGIDTRLPDFYYRLNGTFAIVGKIWGGIHFAIVSASLDLTVYASATVVIEACEPILLTFSAGVSVSLRVKVNLGLFSIRIRLSFHTTISYRFSLGSASSAQWKPQAVLPHSPVGHSGSATGVLEPLTDEEKNVPVKLDWNGVFPEDPVKMVDLYYFTQFSLADDGNHGETEKVVAVGMLFAPTQEKPRWNESLLQPTHIHSELFSFEQIAVAAFCWALNATNSEQHQAASLDRLLTRPVTAVTLANLLYTLHHDREASLFSYRQVVALLQSFFVFNIKDAPDNNHQDSVKDNSEKTALNLSLFPMIPDLYVKPQNKDEILFSDTFPVDNDYLKQVKAVSDRFSMNQQDAGKTASEDAPESLTTLLFRDYFQLLIKALSQSALDAMQVYKFTIPATLGEDQKPPSLYQITRHFTTEDVSEDDVTSIAVSNQNNTTLLNSGAVMMVSDLRYSIEKKDTIAGILETYGLLESGKDADDRLAEKLFELNGDKKIFTAGQSIINKDVRHHEDATHQLDKDDTLNSIVNGTDTNSDIDPSQKAAFINSIKDQAGILQVFRQLVIPPFAHTIKKKETLSTIAGRYRVTIRQLAQANQDHDTFLNIGSKIIIENVRSLNIGELLSYLYHDGSLGHAAGMASRFFMYGLRLPDIGPAGTEADHTDALYRLSGQQFDFDFEEGKEVQKVRLGKVSIDSAEKEDPPETDPLPWVTFNAKTFDPDQKGPLELVHPFSGPEIELAEKYQQTAFSPIIEEGPVSIKRYNDQFKTFPLGHPIVWQAEAGAEKSSSTIPPSIWLFPPALRTIRHQSPNLQMMVGTQPQKHIPMEKAIVPEAQYNWCALLPVTIRKTPAGSGQDGISSNTYEVYGTDAAGIELLTELIRRTNIIDSTHVLFPSNPDENEATALQSYDDSALTLLINTNLSTETNPDTLTAASEIDTPGIPGTSPHDMVVRLWKASLVRTGGYYLYLRNHEGNGLPDNLFGGEETSDIYVLIQYKATQEISGCMNSVCLREAIDTEHSVLFAQWTVPIDDQGRIDNPDQMVKEGKIARIPSILPGHAGFKLVRSNPDKIYGVTGPNASSEDSYAYQLETQYNLLDFQVVENQDFKGMGEGLAVGPEKDHPGEDLRAPSTNNVEPTDLIGPWKYKRVFPLEKIIKNSPARKTAYIGLNKTLEIGFSWRDNYGNRLNPAGFGEHDRLSIPIRYFDYLIPLSQWPHMDIHYEFLTDSPQEGNFRINFLFHGASEYAIESDDRHDRDMPGQIEALKEKVQADLETYETVRDQIRQDDVGLSFSTSMTPDMAGGYPKADHRAVLKSGMNDHVTDIVDRIRRFLNELDLYLGRGSKSPAVPIPVIEDAAYHWTDHIGNTNKENIYPLEVEFRIRRSDALIDAAFKDVPPVRSVKTAVRPKADSPPVLTVKDQTEYSTFIKALDQKTLPVVLADRLNTKNPEVIIRESGKEWQVKSKDRAYVIRTQDQKLYISSTVMGLSQLAESVETVYPGMKVCSAYTKGKQQQDVWIVRFQSSDTTEGIGFKIYHNQALFYAPQPLSTQLISLNQVDIYEHTDYGFETVSEPSLKKSFIRIDPETWALDYLKTLETTLRPEFSIPITMFDTLINNPSSTGFLSGILKAKQKMAEAVSMQTIPILQDHHMKREGLGVAREKLNQQLLINLVDGYTTRAVVQYNVDVVSNYPDPDNPTARVAPNLFGQPYVDHGEMPPDQSPGQKDHPNYSLSTAKVALKGTGENNKVPAASFLTFLFNTRTERYHSVVPLRIDYTINHLEFDIRTVNDRVDSLDPESINRYSVSKWLSFIKPFAAEATHIPITPVPVPIRHYPELPNWKVQQFIAKNLERRSVDIQSAKQMDYMFAYDVGQFTAQDTTHFEVLFNSRQAEEDQLVSQTKATDELDRKLHYSLAQFNEAKDMILEDLRSLLPQVNVDMAGETRERLTKLLSSYDFLVDQVATAWNNRFDPNVLNKLGGPSLRVIKARFNLDEDEDNESNPQKPGRFRVTLTNWSVTSHHQAVGFIAAPMVKINGYRVEAWGYAKDGGPAQAITGDNRFHPWFKVVYHFYKRGEQNDKTYLSFDEGKTLTNRSIHFENLNVLLVQNARAGFHVVRNVKLSKTTPTSEEFIYRTPIKRFANPVTPMFDVSEPLDIAALQENKPAGLSAYLGALVKTLLASRKSNDLSQAIFQPTTLKIVTSYSFSCNPDIGAVLLPCFLVPPTLFDPSDAAGNGSGIQLLKAGIVEWFTKNRPVQTKGRLYFDITFYSLMADNDLPVLRLRQLFIDVKHITTLAQYAE